MVQKKKLLTTLAAKIALSNQTSKSLNKWIAQAPTERQQLFLSVNHVREAFYGGAAGGGKVLANKGLISTPFGWKRGEDLSVGDLVNNPDGTVQRIINLTEEMRLPLWRVHFADGTSTDVAEGHLWQAWKGNKGRKISNARLFGEQTAEVIETKELKSWLDRGYRPQIPVCREVPFNRTSKEQGRIDPYLLGVLLGDGCITKSASISITCSEDDKPHYLSRFGVRDVTYSGHQSIRFTGDFRKHLVSKLQLHGLLGTRSNTKFIPEIYKLGSVEARYELVRGLMDTDGYSPIDKNACYFNTASHRLADDMAFVLRSLGCVVTINRTKAGYKDKDGTFIQCQDSYELYIKSRQPDLLFSLHRKQHGRPNKNISKAVIKVEINGEIVGRCLTVSNPNGLYITNDFIVTHNSSCMLMAALEFVDIPGYSALILRKNFSDLTKPGALISRAHEWLTGTGAKWHEGNHKWTFPSGATLTFGYIETENDKFQYLGAEYQFIGFDEVTQFSESSYTYLFSRLRRLAGSDIPLRVRAASNPGGPGARWVYKRFIPEGFTPADAEVAQVFWKEDTDSDGEDLKRAFIPAKLQDNPHLDQEEYIESLRSVDPITREQMLRGDWQISERGDIYPMWSELHHVISWSQFAKFYNLQYKGIPPNWLRGVFMDAGTTEGHPNVTSWFATAAENAPLAGSVFLYRGHCTYNKTVRELAEEILSVPMSEREKVTHWLMSHEASSERISFNRDFGIPFAAWKADRNRGIAQVRNYLEIRSKHLPHPFKPDIKGRPSLYLIVDDDQLLHPIDDRGLERWRAEFPAYHYKALASGDISSTVMPHPLFNDAMDCTRAAGAAYFSPTLPLTTDERIQNEMAQIFSGRTFDDVLALPPEQRCVAIDSWRIKEAEIRKKQETRKVTSGIVKWRKRARAI